MASKFRISFDAPKDVKGDIHIRIPAGSLRKNGKPFPPEDIVSPPIHVDTTKSVDNEKQDVLN